MRPTPADPRKIVRVCQVQPTVAEYVEVQADVDPVVPPIHEHVRIWTNFRRNAFRYAHPLYHLNQRRLVCQPVDA